MGTTGQASWQIGHITVTKILELESPLPFEVLFSGADSSMADFDADQSHVLRSGGRWLFKS